MSKRVAIYARVSTTDQTAENQLHELRAVAERNDWQICDEFIDHGISGAKGRAQRPALDRLMKAAVRKDFDLIMSWSVDRLGRSMKDLLDLLDELKAKKIDLYLHQQNIDTTTPSGKMLFSMCGVFAEFEQSLIKERVKAGLARARTAGRIGGRPSLASATKQAILDDASRGIYTREEIAKKQKVGIVTVYRVLKGQKALTKAPQEASCVDRKA